MISKQSELSCWAINQVRFLSISGARVVSVWMCDIWMSVSEHIYYLQHLDVHTIYNFGINCSFDLVYFKQLNIFFLKRSIFQNLLETVLLPRFFVFWVGDFKLWLLAYFLISFNCKVSERLDSLDFVRVTPLMFFDFVIYQKFKGGTLIKCLISMLFNLAENLHS